MSSFVAPTFRFERKLTASETAFLPLKEAGMSVVEIHVVSVFPPLTDRQNVVVLLFLCEVRFCDGTSSLSF
jgi:hypothetical protein